MNSKDSGSIDVKAILSKKEEQKKVKEDTKEKDKPKVSKKEKVPVKNKKVSKDSKTKKTTKKKKDAKSKKKNKGYLKQRKVLVPLVIVGLFLVVGMGFVLVGMSTPEVSVSEDDVSVTENFEAAEEGYEYSVVAENSTMHKYYVRVKLKTSMDDSEEKDWLLENISDTWKYENGYCYYKEPLKGGEKSPSALKSVMLDKSFLIEENGESVFLLESDYVRSGGNNSAIEAFKNE